MRRFSKLSWRTRLLIAFMSLIVASASATIVIGNAVLGSQILSLAQSKADSDLMIAWQVWRSRLDFMHDVLESIASQPHSDIDEADATILRMSPAQERFDILSVIDVRSIRDDDLGDGARDLIHESAKRQQAIATPLILRVRDVRREAPWIELKERMAQFQVEDSVLAIACAAPIRNHSREIIGVAFAATVINGLNGWVDEMAAAMRPKRDGATMGVAVTIFQGDRRVATAHVTAGSGVADYDIPIFSRADDKVIRRVLGEQGFYLGLATVEGVDYYTAYRPILDFRDRAIGILGIGTTVGEYREAQSRTVWLFSTLVAGGMIFGVAMSWAFAGWLVRPLSKLAEGVERVAEGDLSHKVRISSGDELGRLAVSFNRMVQAVQERDQMLREATEHRLSEVEKQISIGRLAAGVAHEINNPMTSVLSLSSLMLRHCGPEDANREDLEIIVAETTRCREIVAGLLDFARERPVAKRVIDLNAVVRDTLVLVRNYNALESVRVDPSFFPGHLFVMADPRQIQQVFTNVILNAAEAIHDRMSVEPGAPAVITIGLDDDSSGAFAEVKIQDTGPGITEENIKKIFEPFFTTKGKSKGTGLGLSVSLGIIQKHNGYIRVESPAGGGACVTVTLPLMAIESQAVSFT